MHRLLESYLSEVAAHLSALPVVRRNEELREMRSHLLSAVEAYQERGETEAEADGFNSAAVRFVCHRSPTA